MIASRRFQQNAYAAAASMNRAAGSGAGSGFANIGMLGSAAFGFVGGITAASVPTVITGSTVTFSLSRTQTVWVQGTVNGGSNCAVGSFNLLALNGDTGLALLDQGSYPVAILGGAGVGTINYLPATLFVVLLGQPGPHTVNWQVDAATTGSVTVYNGHLDIFTTTS